jgi:hypothetical protein
LATKEGLTQLATKEDLKSDAFLEKLKAPPLVPPNRGTSQADIIISNVTPAWGIARPVVLVTLQARSGAPARLINGNIKFCPANGASTQPDNCPPASAGKCRATLTCRRAQVGPGWSQVLCATIPRRFAQDPNVGFTLMGELRLSDGAGKTFSIPLAYDMPLTATLPPDGARLNLGRPSGCEPG